MAIELFAGATASFAAAPEVTAITGIDADATSNSNAVDSSPLSDVSASASASVDASQPVRTSVNDAHKPKAFFWRATKGNDTVYLLGTIHGAIARFYPLPAAIDQALDQSRHLMVELAIDKIDGMKVSKMRDELGTYKGPERLSKHLTEETRAVFAQYLKWSGESWEMYEKFKPWYAAEVASRSKQWHSESFRASLGLDLYCLARAREAGKAVTELETVEQQLHVHADLSEKAQDMLLREAILNFQKLDEQTRGYLDAWKAGDVKKMEELATADARRHPELAEWEKRLLDDRNVGMLNKIKQLLKVKGGPHFVAVGAAHLVGKTGLVSLFEKDGWTVEQFSSAPPEVTRAASSVKRQVFSERFKLWLPDQPRRVVQGDTVRYEFHVPPDGAYMVSVFTSPTEPSEWPVPGPLMLDKLVSIFKPDPDSRKSFTLGGIPGREIQCSGTVFDTLQKGLPVTTTARSAPRRALRAPSQSPATLTCARLPGRAKIRAYLAGRRFYLLCAVGTKSFLNSDNVARFFDSLEFVSN